MPSSSDRASTARSSWASESVQSSAYRGRSITVHWRGRAVSYRQLLEGLAEDADAREVLLQTLAEAPYAAFYWEVVPVCQASVERPFECVLLDAADLVGEPPDPYAFSEYFRSDVDVVHFDNLGGDAILVVPCPRGRLAAYPHLAAFVREAPPAQRHELLRQVARLVCERLTTKPLWVSTAGNGVAWVHVRLDQRPKYYRYAAYRAPSTGARS